MNPVIQQLILKRFRSIPTEQWSLTIPLFLSARMAAGKSNFVRAFSFLADAMTSPLQAVFDKQGGIAVVRNRSSAQSYPPNLGLAVVFGPLNGEIASARYAFEIRALPNYGFEVVREQCLVDTMRGERCWFEREKNTFRTSASVPGLEPALDAAALALPVVGGHERFSPVLRALASMRVYSIDPAKVREMQDPDSGAALRFDGSNAASVLQTIERNSSGAVDRICEILSAIVPNTVHVRPTKHGNKLSLEFTQKWAEKKQFRFEAFNMSDGTLRALGLLMAVYQSSAPSLIAIEEPEATIHPGALGAVLDLLQQASRKMQVVVTTHSPELLDAKWIEDKHLRLVTWHEGATHVTRVSDASRRALQEHLMGAGELLRSNVLALDTPPLFLDASQKTLFADLA